MPSKFVKSIGRTLDARPDRLDLRDREFTPRIVCLPDVWPDDATIKRLVPGYCKAGLVLNQEAEGACTGFGLACVINYLYWRDAIARTPKRARIDAVSPRMLYHLARFYDEWPGEDYEGSSCRGALKAWHKHGVCTDARWPYRDENQKVRFVTPEEGWAEDALQRRLGVYYRVNRGSVVDMQAAILEIGAIYVSSDVHDGWGVASKKPEVTGHSSLPVIQPIRNEDSAGGHAYALVGFNRTGFVVQNSWGQAWGNCGFAVLPYEEWVKYGSDAWITALGVPAAQTKASSTPVPSARKVVVARAGGLAFVAARRPPPKVSRKVAPWSVEDAYRHTLVLGNEGAVINRIVTLETAADCVRTIACEAPMETLKRSGRPQRVVVYAHGGLNSEDAAIERIQTLAPYFDANGVYPIFLAWRTGPTETLRAILEDELQKTARPEGAVSDWFDRVKQTAAEALDRTVEVLARPAAKPIWSEMKQNAAAAADPARGLSQLADALAALKARRPGLEVHLVGHSAGSILLGHLLDLLPARDLSAASCHLYAPACTVGFALEHYLPAIDREALDRKRLHLHLLSDERECADSLGPYRKSLLYLVSRALERAHKTPILGLQHMFDSRGNARWCDDDQAALHEWQKFWKSSGASLDVVSEAQISTGTLGRKIPASHGCFDNDAATIELTLKRITGAAPAHPVEWIDY